MAATRSEEGLDRLLADALDGNAPRAEDLVRFVDDPDSLPADVRAELERLQASDPEIADRLRVLRELDLDAVLSESTANAVGSEGRVLPMTRPARRHAPTRRSRWLSAGGGALAAAAGFAAAALLLPRGGSDPGQIAKLEQSVASERARADELERSLADANRSPVDSGEARIAELEAELRRHEEQVAALTALETEAREALAEATRISNERAQQIARLEADPGDESRVAAGDRLARARIPTAAPSATPSPTSDADPRILREPILIASNSDFASPNRGDPSTRIVLRSAHVSTLPKLTAWVPEQVGWTIETQPNIYIHLSKATSLPVQVRIARDGQIVVERTLTMPISAGLLRISLADLGVRLDLDKTYQWMVAVQVDRAKASRDIIVGGELRRVPVPDDVRRARRQGDPGAYLTALERSGMWYDAIDLVSEWIALNPSASNLQSRRRDLLSIAGIKTTN